MHQGTLLGFAPSIPVVAGPEVMRAISGWNHFEHVVERQAFKDDGASSWRDAHPGSPLPRWLTVMRLPPTLPLNICTAMVWSHGEGQGGDETWHEVVTYSPHGFDTAKPTLTGFLESAPRVRVLGMLHALKDSYAGRVQTTFGVDNGLAMERLLQPKYWVRTADGELNYAGLIWYVVNDLPRTLGWGLQRERGSDPGGAPKPKPNLVTIDNGCCHVLE